MEQKFKKGDRVEIFNTRAQYTTFKAWAEHHSLRNFRYSAEASRGDVGIVIATGPHLDGLFGGTGGVDQLVGIRLDNGDEVIFSQRGISKVVTLFSMDKPVFTAEGTPVQIVTTQGRDEKYPVLAYEGKATTLSKYTLEGKSKSGVARRHLTNVQAAPEPEREFFVNLYDDSEGWNGNTDDTLHLTKEAAAKYDAQQRTTHENFPKRAGLGKVVLVEGRLPKSILKQLDKKG